MAQLLTAWEYSLLSMDVDDWLDLNPCECEARCTCDERTDDAPAP